MPKKDYYQILGVSKNAPESEIKKAYPSKSESEKRKAEEQMKEINQAYGVLSDKEKKQRYDAYGSEETFFRPTGGADFERFRRSSPIIDEILSSFMQDFEFRGGTEYWQDRARAANREKNPQPGQDLVFSLPLTQKELISGTKKKVAFSVARICLRCQQTGVDTECVICKGQGIIDAVQQTFLGNFRFQTTCYRCQGRCPQCLGRKFVIQKKTLEISVPPGLKPNQKLRSRETGNDSLHELQPISEEKILVIRQTAEETVKTFWRENSSVSELINGKSVMGLIGIVHIEGKFQGLKTKLEINNEKDRLIKLITLEKEKEKSKETIEDNWTNRCGEDFLINGKTEDVLNDKNTVEEVETERVYMIKLIIDEKKKEEPFIPETGREEGIISPYIVGDEHKTEERVADENNDMQGAIGEKREELTQKVDEATSEEDQKDDDEEEGREIFLDSPTHMDDDTRINPASSLKNNPGLSIETNIPVSSTFSIAEKTGSGEEASFKSFSFSPGTPESKDKKEPKERRKSTAEKFFNFMGFKTPTKEKETTIMTDNPKTYSSEEEAGENSGSKNPRLNYSRFMRLLTLAQIKLNRKQLSEIAL
ncbi:5793_t:CDS:2 [Racocetra fulgida]|uniref:5793_t:CDS:1 n=1 Tax=Racocetra fulgida TaxID=60492 RepID=A0A9N9CT93_9GLOM|nr:5793_t:CDS:2 [Racocetra fulgida]